MRCLREIFSPDYPHPEERLGYVIVFSCIGFLLVGIAQAGYHIVRFVERVH